MVLYYGHEKLWYKINYGLDLRNRTKLLKKKSSLKLMSSNTVKHNYKTTKQQREDLHKHKAYLLWFTGLSGSGKSTLANLVEIALHEQGLSTYVLDGDNIRQGINKDLSFSPDDRKENIRRIAEISNLMLDAGIITLAAFVSPYIKDREEVKQIVGADNFIEIYVNTSLEECERRDVKGLYKKARSGEIKNMTGISAPYEAPLQPKLEVITDGQPIESNVKAILKFLNKKVKI
jgi:adenylylsulfate kinase